MLCQFVEAKFPRSLYMNCSFDLTINPLIKFTPWSKQRQRKVYSGTVEDANPLQKNVTDTVMLCQFVEAKFPRSLYMNCSFDLTVNI